MSLAMWLGGATGARERAPGWCYAESEWNACAQRACPLNKRNLRTNRTLNDYSYDLILLIIVCAIHVDVMDHQANMGRLQGFQAMRSARSVWFRRGKLLSSLCEHFTNLAAVHTPAIALFGN